MGNAIRILVRSLIAVAVLTVATVAMGGSPAGAQTSDWDLVAPNLECVTVNGNGTFTALFGTSNYTSWPLTFNYGLLNSVSPGNDNQGQPTRIDAGRHVGVFTVTKPVGQTITYQLGVTSVRATSTSVPCNTAPQVAEAPFVVGLLAVAGAVAVLGYRRLRVAPALA